MSITVDAASYDYGYVACLTDTNGVSRVYISSAPIHAYSRVANATSSSRGFFGIGSITGNDIIELVYNTSLNQWQTSGYISAVEPDYGSLFIFGTSTSYSVQRDVMIDYQTMYPNNIYQKYSIITNVDMTSKEQNFFTGYSNDLTQLPQGLTESAIRDIIDQQINTQTASGSTAQNIINNTTQNYNLYLSGDIDSTEMREIVENNLDTLSDLTPSTLLDSMQINNALTYNQSIQDQLLNTASSDLSTFLADQIATANSVFKQYRDGTRTQQDVLSRLRELIVAVSQKSSTYTTTADLSAINATVNTINSIVDSISNLKDLEVDVSDKVQQSDAEEIEYLEQLTSEVTSTITDIAPSKNFTASQTGDAKQVMELIWENEFVKRLLPMCAGFMVVCVVLGIRYKV